jgi:hypothetical protein
VCCVLNETRAGSARTRTHTHTHTHKHKHTTRSWSRTVSSLPSSNSPGNDPRRSLGPGRSARMPSGLQYCAAATAAAAAATTAAARFENRLSVAIRARNFEVQLCVSAGTPTTTPSTRGHSTANCQKQLMVITTRIAALGCGASSSNDGGETETHLPDFSSAARRRAMISVLLSIVPCE